MWIIQNQKTFHTITNLWTVFYLVFIVGNFFLANRYDFLVSPFSALYIGTLSIYIGSKEFDRWYESHEGRRRGERFVIVWTVIMTALLGGALILGEAYKIPSDIVATYIAVLTIFILTQKSKRLYAQKEKRSK